MTPPTNVTAAQVSSLYEQATVMLPLVPSDWLDTVNAFRRAARTYRTNGDEVALAAAIAAYGPAFAAVSSLASGPKPKPKPACEGTTKSNLPEAAPPQPLPYGAVVLPLDLIDPNPANPRLVLHSATIEALTNNMRENGFDPNHPLIVRLVDGRYENVGGHHRAVAAGNAGLTEVPCVIVEKSDAEVVLLLASDNNQSALTKLEQALHSLKAERFGVSVKAYAASVGLKPTNLSRYRRGAVVFQAVGSSLSEDDVIFLQERAEHLAAIGGVDSAEWRHMVRALVDEKWTLKRTRKEVAKLVAPLATPEAVDSPEEKPEKARAVSPGTTEVPESSGATTVPTGPTVTKAKPADASSVQARRLAFIANKAPFTGQFIAKMLAYKTFLDNQHKDSRFSDLIEKARAEQTISPGMFDLTAEELAALMLFDLGEAKAG